MENSTKKRVKNHQYLAELALQDFLNKHNIKFKIESGIRHSIDFLIFDEIHNDYVYFIDISQSGFMHPSNGVQYADGTPIKELFDLFIKENSCEITQEIDNEYKKIKKFMYKNQKKMNRYVGMSHNGYTVVYSKKIKRLVVYPDIGFRRIAASFNLCGDLKMVHESGYLSGILHEEAHYLMNDFLEKPLNKYTDDELTLMDMIDI